jgi:hypothetical protein
VNAVAVPRRFAVIIPAEKLPLPSRATMALGVLLAVAVVALLATFPAVMRVASLVSEMAAVADTSASVIGRLRRKLAAPVFIVRVWSDVLEERRVSLLVLLVDRRASGPLMTAALRG